MLLLESTTLVYIVVLGIMWVVLYIIWDVLIIHIPSQAMDN